MVIVCSFSSRSCRASTMITIANGRSSGPRGIPFDDQKLLSILRRRIERFYVVEDTVHYLLQLPQDDINEKIPNRSSFMIEIDFIEAVTLKTSHRPKEKLPPICVRSYFRPLPFCLDPLFSRTMYRSSHMLLRGIFKLSLLSFKLLIAAIFLFDSIVSSLRVLPRELLARVQLRKIRGKILRLKWIEVYRKIIRENIVEESKFTNLQIYKQTAELIRK